MQTAQQHPELQTAVAALCVAWWQKGAPGREQLVAQLTVYLCARAVRSGDVFVVFAAATGVCSTRSCVPSRMTQRQQTSCYARHAFTVQCQACSTS